MEEVEEVEKVEEVEEEEEEGVSFFVSKLPSPIIIDDAFILFFLSSLPSLRSQ